MKSLGVILARGGSKRLPRKNILPFCGHPLIYYSINAALQSHLTDVVVSSDEEEILRIARSCECNCIKRPSTLAKDETPSFSALLHAVEQMEEQKDIRYDKIALLQPTSPQRTSAMINTCLSINSDATATIERIDLNQFKLNGAIFILKRKLLDLITKPKPYLIDDLEFLEREYDIVICTVLTKHLVDIDTKEDFIQAEQEMNNNII